MKSALICTSNDTLRSALLASLAQAEFAVSHVATQDEILRTLKYATHDLLIAEQPKSSFSELLKLTIRLNPRISVLVMNNSQIFCLYPFQRQSADVIQAIKEAGVKISNQLLRHTNPDWPFPDDVVLLP